MKVFRLHYLSPQSPDPFRPRAAAGRWNDAGWQVAYTSDSVALAAIEILGYWKQYQDLDRYTLYSLTLPDDQLQDATHIDPADTQAAKAYGNAWLTQGESLALRVRSVVLPESFNVLVNPIHPAFADLVPENLGPFDYGERIQELIRTAKQK